MYVANAINSHVTRSTTLLIRNDEVIFWLDSLQLYYRERV